MDGINTPKTIKQIQPQVVIPLQMDGINTVIFFIISLIAVVIPLQMDGINTYQKDARKQSGRCNPPTNGWY